MNRGTVSILVLVITIIFVHLVYVTWINPNVEIQQTGIKWIGEIPRGWDVKPLKYVSNFTCETLITNDVPFESM